MIVFIFTNQRKQVFRQKLPRVIFVDAVPYWHEYLIFDSSQILPVYLIQFEYDPEEDERKRVCFDDLNLMALGTTLRSV